MNFLSKSQFSDFLSEICKNYDNLSELEVVPKVDPGFLRDSLPQSIPLKGISFQEICKETFENIHKGATQWQHPAFFGYYPSSMSHTTILAEIYANAFQSNGSFWKDCPSQTELESLIVDWLISIMNLPSEFSFKSNGGGHICLSATHAYFDSIVIAKHRKLKELNIGYDNKKKYDLVAYFTEPAYAWSEKALRLKEIKHTRKINVYLDKEIGNYVINFNEFEEIIKEDLSKGLIPFWCGTTIGYTATCGIDDQEKFGNICKKYNIFMNTDAAYACSFFILPEFQQKFVGLGNTDSLIVNLSKNFMISNVGTVFFIKDKALMSNAFNNNEKKSDSIENFGDWGLGLSKKWNSLKVYFLIKSLGRTGLQEYIRNYIELTKYLEELMKNDSRFEIHCKREFSIIVFRVVPPLSSIDMNEAQREFYNLCIKNTNDGYFSLSHIEHVEIMRIVIGNPNNGIKEIKVLWNKIKKCCDDFYSKYS